MAVRKIIEIDENKCDGCGLCANACHEGAIQMINGKAKLVRDDYCDGLGDCIGSCPQDAITIIERDAAAYDQAAVDAHLGKSNAAAPKMSGCPGTMARSLAQKDSPSPSSCNCQDASTAPSGKSMLGHWPVQLTLLAPNAPYFQNADLLLAADCVPFAVADFHGKFLAGKTVAVGCPKLDDAGSYVEKLTQIFKLNKINSLTVVHMEVPCCSGMMAIAMRAIEAAGIELEIKDIMVSLQGDILSENVV